MPRSGCIFEKSLWLYSSGWIDTDRARGQHLNRWPFDSSAKRKQGLDKAAVTVSLSRESSTDLRCGKVSETSVSGKRLATRPVVLAKIMELGRTS